MNLSALKREILDSIANKNPAAMRRGMYHSCMGYGLHFRIGVFNNGLP
jgi:hypothetical protein